MGLFDLFKRNAAVADDDGPSPDYAMAHYTLRQLALSNPMPFLAAVASPDCKEFFGEVMNDVRQACGRRPTFKADRIQVHPVRVKDFPCAVIEFPEPKDFAEAHMVALVLQVDGQQLGHMDSEEDIPARYFTLEKGFSMPGDPPRTVLAEWADQSHINFGDGPRANVKSFVKSLREFF